ncbi:hypothetical protein [Nitrosomonas communis]|uniref:hypothetical protein n=1 Tax=Nitrosomonas communis TaxID=44574 RepID=UPI0015A5A5FF|nr:hypothetical protein [Nitrosomonas communis]
MTKLADGSDHLVLARIAFASGVFFDGAHRHSLVGDVVMLTPRGERCPAPSQVSLLLNTFDVHSHKVNTMYMKGRSARITINRLNSFVIVGLLKSYTKQ